MVHFCSGPPVHFLSVLDIHNEFGVTDSAPFQSFPLDSAQAHKLRVSWHIGLGDMAGDILPRSVKFVRGVLPPSYPTRFPPVDADRPIDVMFRGSRKYKRATVSFPREHIGDLLDNMHDLNKALQGHVSIRQYVWESKQAKLMISPFGWGELGVRDFQAWIGGAALVKQDISHMETWPDVFRPEETYLPFSWGLTYLESRIRDTLADESRQKALAEAGRAAYRDMVSSQGMERFCKRFCKLIGSG